MKRDAYLNSVRVFYDDRALKIIQQVVNILGENRCSINYAQYILEQAGEVINKCTPVSKEYPIQFPETSLSQNSDQLSPVVVEPKSE
ncbi:hypothetical protein PaeBR_18670 [Paenibacillus sp. BR2-3]|uniref:hypothetical protein n=1 Tax=Paenibacillus sp. BR2-3 TaxID=3048494 RepID=UPI003977590C